MSTAAESIAGALDAAGTEVVFCLPGEETIALVDALAAVGIELVVVRHEQHGAFMAATHGRLTGRPGVLVTTLGPGMTNAVTGLAHATLGGFPLVHIAGQKPRRGNWEGSFQVIDQVAAARPVTKSAVAIEDPDDAASTVAQALRAAADGRPGAVFVELPQDVAQAETSVRRSSTAAERSGTSAPPQAPDRKIDRLVDLVDAARFPVLVLGSGCQSQEVADALAACTRALGLPAVPLQMGIGALPADDANAMPPIPMHSPDAARVTLAEADLAIVLGYHPTEHPPLAWSHDGQSIAHVAPWPATHRRGFEPSVELVGDIAHSLRRLVERATPRNTDHARATRQAVIDQLHAEDLDTSSELASSIEVVDAVRAAVPRDGRVALDNGSYKLWFARHFPTYVVNGLLLDNALATMGAGLATAMEAARLEPDRVVVAVVGDGGFLMNVGDLETAIRLELTNLTVVVLRDDTYGFIADHQRERGASRIAVDIGNPDIVGLAEAFGADGVSAASGAELADVLRDAVERPRLVVVDCPFDEQADRRLHAIDSFDQARRRLRADTSPPAP